MTVTQRNAEVFDDAELIAFLQGAADGQLAARVEVALDTQPELVDRMQALDTGLPVVRGAMDRLLQDAPNAGLARALADASVTHATNGAGTRGGWSTSGWLAAAIGLSLLAFAAGIYAGGWRPNNVREGQTPTKSEVTEGHQDQQRAPAPDPTMPSPPSLPASQAPDVTAPADLPPIAAPQTPTAEPPAIPPSAEIAAPAPEIAVPSPAPAIAAGPPEVSPAASQTPSPTATPDLAQPAAAPTGADVPVVADLLPSPAATAPTGPPSSTTAWVQAVAGYVRLMTAETLQQTGQSRAEIRTRLATMSRRFGIDLRALERSVAKLDLKRVDILELNARPLLQLGFVDEDGAPLAICIILRAGAATAKGPPAAATFESEGALGLNAVHWSRQPLGLLVIGRGQPSQMLDTARRIDRVVRPL